MREPAPLELREQAVGPAHRVGVAGHALGPPVLALGHEVGPFQHGHVFLHGGERHVVARGELAHRRFRAHDTRQDVAPRGVGQRPEEMIEGVRRGLTIYNHVVVDRTTGRRKWEGRATNGVGGRDGPGSSRA